MTDNTQELDEIPPRFALYLKARAMRDDDRSMPYIAKNLGFNNASSVDSLLKRYAWFYRWHNKQIEELLDRIESRGLNEDGGSRYVNTPDGYAAATAWNEAQDRVGRVIEAERNKIEKGLK